MAPLCTPENVAAVVKTFLEGRGAIFTLRDDGNMHANLDAVDPARLTGTQDDWANLILFHAEEIKALIRAERTQH